MVRATRRACIEIYGSVEAATAETCRVVTALTQIANGEHAAVAYTALHCLLEVFEDELEAKTHDQPIANTPV